MRIGDLTARTGVSRRLLRYYEEQGLLRPLRLPNGYREYAESDVATVRHIRSLLAAGLPTTAIAEVVHCVHDEGPRVVPSGCPGMIAHLEQENARVTETIARLRATKQALDTLLTAARQHPGPPSPHTPLTQTTPDQGSGAEQSPSRGRTPT